MPNPPGLNKPTGQASSPRETGSAPRMVVSESARVALVPGALGALAGVAAMFIVRVFLGVPTPAELFGDRVAVLIPLGVFSALIDFFGHDAKHLFYASLVVAQVVGGSLLSAVYWGARAAWTGRAARRAKAGATAAQSAQSPAPGVADMAALAALFWVVSALVMAPLVGAGILGVGFAGGALTLLAADAAPALAGPVVFAELLRRRLTRPLRAAVIEGPASPARRRLLRDAGWVVGAVVGAAALWELVVRGANVLGLNGAPPALDLGTVPTQIDPPPVPTYGAWTPVVGLTPEVTPTSAFYYVSKNLVSDPGLVATNWSLRVHGLVNQSYSLTYSDLRALPSAAQDQTLECISNEVGGNLMSTAHWTGVGLTDLLNRAGIQPGASELIFRCADGYSDSVPLARAMGPRALVVYDINGAPLPRPHGFPARLLVPGLYGMKNGKWVTELELGSGGYTGYWEQQGWSRTAIVKTMARIDAPTNGAAIRPRPTFIAGVAFAGDRGIARVDVSMDGGRNWTAADLKRPLAAQTWVLWELPWRPERGNYVIAARAVDGGGYVQSPHPAPPLPDGAEGYHAIAVTVA